ncbi:MAG TPA: AmmeMemoRadiSam system protein B [Salinivirgaceae bacterium]|nr:AmmeMemoRadiSam system protein B [Salinivirgaceae bacterium]
MESRELKRKPYVAGRFYPANPDKLNQELKRLYEQSSVILPKKTPIIGGVVPHAGYMFSGHHAMAFFKTVQHQNYHTIIIISPSHTGFGPEISLDAHEQWELPTGNLLCDADLQKSGLFELSFDAQIHEHAAEVMLPMIHFVFPSTPPIGIITIRKPSFETAQKVARQLFEYQKQSGKNLLIIASSDFNHFETAEIGKDKDDLVLNKIFEQNTAEVETTVRNHRVSVCGFGPIMALMEYSKLISSNIRVEIVSRGHSGEIIPSDEVVDYISMIFYPEPSTYA